GGVGVGGVGGAGNGDGRLGVLAQRNRERGLRHGVRAQERQLVGFRLRVGEVGGAALPGGGAERIRHSDLVTGRPRRGILRRSGKWANQRRRDDGKGAKDAVHDVLP